MRSVRGKAGGLFEASLQALEGRVQHTDQSADFIGRTLRGNSFIEPFCGDPLRRAAEFVQSG